MLTYVENGTEFTCEFGDIDEPYYDSLESVLDEMVKLLRKEGRDLYPRFQTRIQSLKRYAGKIGWGYGDYLGDQVYLLETQLGSPEGEPERK